MKKVFIGLAIVGAGLSLWYFWGKDDRMKYLVGTYNSGPNYQITLKDNGFCQVIRKEQHRMNGTYYQMVDYRKSVGGTGIIDCTNGGICYYWDTIVIKSTSCYYELEDDYIKIMYSNKKGSFTGRYTYSKDYNKLTVVVDSGNGMEYTRD